MGRLDADTSGLLLFSRAGELTHRLLHPSTGVPREYEATIENEVDVERLQELLKNGVEKITPGMKVK